MRILLATALALTLFGHGAALAQTAPPETQLPKPAPTQRPQQTPQKPPAAKPAVVPATTVPVEAGFTIGPEDVLGILVWRDQEMSGDVTVRSDGMISLPLIRDVKAAGLTPAELADRIQTAVREFVTDASVTVVVRQMNSRKVFITGEVARPGAYPLASSMTVMQLIAIAGGLTEFANGEDILVMRSESAGMVRPAGEPVTFRLNYKELTQRRNLKQNIVLKPGDTVVVPEK